MKIVPKVTTKIQSSKALSITLASVCASALGLQVETAKGQDAEPLLEGSINAQRFNPAPGPRNFITTRTARSDGENAFSLGVLASFGSDPFIVSNADSDTNVIQGIFTGDVLVSYTPTPIFQLGLRLPVTYAQGNGINTEDGSPGTFIGEDIEAAGLSDPELEAKLRFVGKVDSPFAMGAAAFVGAPLGEATAEGAYIGSDSVIAGLRVIADGKAGPMLFGLNLGYRSKEEGRIGTAEFGSEGFYSAAVGVNLGPTVILMADLFGSTQFGDDPSTNASELDAALKYNPGNSSWTITAGGGLGLAQGSVGVPGFRALAGLSYTNETADSDGDGLNDAQDQCPTAAEDVDGFDDGDGCPDPDNDGDALADAADKCPDEAEDIDKFEDTDGCADKDNDKDGIPDVNDRCPDEAETVNGFEDADGCPDVPDKDGDGVEDDKDKCPDQAEDTDGFEDTDGCPDPDNDGDGIPDERDECVDTAEDMNGVEDEDGCPEDE